MKCEPENSRRGEALRSTLLLICSVHAQRIASSPCRPMLWSKERHKGRDNLQADGRRPSCEGSRSHGRLKVGVKAAAAACDEMGSMFVQRKNSGERTFPAHLEVSHHEGACARISALCS